MEIVVKCMRWKAFFFLKGKEDDQADDDVDDQTRTGETFGFKTRKCTPEMEEMDKFEDDLLKMIERVQCKKGADDFQNTLPVHEDIDTIRKSKDVMFVSTRRGICMLWQKVNMKSYWPTAWPRTTDQHRQEHTIASTKKPR